MTECHLPAFQALGLEQEVTVIDPSVSSLQRLSLRFPKVKTIPCGYADYFSRPLQKGLFAAALVALPNALHFEAVNACLDQGLAVLCEKPLAMTEAQCLALGARARERGLLLGVGMVRRFMPQFRAMQEAIATGLIGALREISVELGTPYHWPSVSGNPFRAENGGELADMGVHYLDLLQELCGTLQPDHYEDDAWGGVEANCVYRLRGGDVAVTMRLSRTDQLSNTVRVTGTDGTLWFDTNRWDGCFWERGDLAGLAPVRLEPRVSFASGPWEPNFSACFVEQLAEFIQRVRDGAAVRVSAERAAGTMRLIEWAYGRRNENRAMQLQATAVSPRTAFSGASVVVTGGTGFIGGFLVERLARSGCASIGVPVRSYQTCVQASRFPVSLRKTDLLSFSDTRALLKGARYVFHLAYGKDPDSARRVTVEGTKNVVNAAVELGAECVVVLSTMYVFGFPVSATPVDETFPYAPYGKEYAQSKAEMERWCLQAASRSRATRIVVLNPTCVFGPFAPAYTVLPAQLARAGQFCWIEEGRGLANYVYVDNLVDAILAAALVPAAHGERFIINDGTCTWRQFLSALLGECAAQLPSYTQRQLASLGQVAPARFRDLLFHLAGDYELLEIINRLPVIGALKNALVRRGGRVHACLASLRQTSSLRLSRAGAPPVSTPPPWLAELFPPAQSRFSAEKARRLLHWSSAVSLEEAQRRTREWLVWTRRLSAG